MMTHILGHVQEYALLFSMLMQSSLIWSLLYHIWKEHSCLHLKDNNVKNDLLEHSSDAVLVWIDSAGMMLSC